MKVISRKSKTWKLFTKVGAGDPFVRGRTDAEAETPILWPPDAKN